MTILTIFLFKQSRMLTVGCCNCDWWWWFCCCWWCWLKADEKLLNADVAEWPKLSGESMVICGGGALKCCWWWCGACEWYCCWWWCDCCCRLWCVRCWLLGWCSDWWCSMPWRCSLPPRPSEADVAELAAVAAASWNELIESKSLTSEKLLAVAASAADDAACIVAWAIMAFILACSIEISSQLSWFGIGRT